MKYAYYVTKVLIILVFYLIVIINLTLVIGAVSEV